MRMLSALSSFMGGDASRNGHVDITLESRDFAYASLAVGGTIANVEKVTQHSDSEGSFGWKEDTLWVAEGLRATFRVYFCQWLIDVDLDSQDLQRAELDLKHAIKGAAIQTQRSKSSGSFGWDGSTLWVVDGLRAHFDVTLHRQAATPPPPYCGPGPSTASELSTEQRLRNYQLAAGRTTNAAGSSTEAAAALADRGEKLASLSSKVSALAGDAEEFYKMSKELNRG
mmetsp:Transcript_21989/g.47344  ORF Transcript_21989/g.47344 Transcript_21989/m.47344 type:complete len:227 (-) Transcript_21989:211-891(-)|eukprot:CAMPEP_0183337652 /NCGR_PEP_ID=MMETSP0164_2-20130417/5215_1 /TAXON_ID=221442 /ORGANISM="Coccolithus pelagicus ssp braarudi, Strain PLY182g" /LENGTH=226 /DNA_ID=CAMNT_0025507375 /DNA_START=171 /DNA_END=851 /DNA_ORIENTATION=+